MGTDWIECLDKRPTDRTGHDLVPQIFTKHTFKKHQKIFTF